MKKNNGLARKVIAMAVMVMMVFQVGLGSGTAFAADNATYNMDDAITKVSIKAMVEGSWYEIPQNYDPNMPEIKKDAAVKVSINYEPSLLSTDFKAGDKIVYNLPAGIKISKAQGGDVYDGPTVVGEYQISTDGKITITVTNEQYVQDSGGILKNGTISFDGSFESSAWGKGGKKEIKFGDVELGIKFKEDAVVTKAVLNVSKKQTEAVIDRSNPDNSYIKYTITVTAPSDNTQDMPNVTVLDEFTAGSSYIDTVSQVSATKGSFSSSTKIWTIGTMKPGETQTLVIKAKLNDKIFAAGNAVGDRTITNKATVKSNGTTKNSSSVSTKANSSLNITKTNGTYTYDPATKKAQLTYTVKVTAPSTNKWDITNVSVYDYFDTNKKYVLKYDSVNAPAGTTATSSATNKNLTWTIGTMKPGDTKTLTYTVDIDDNIFLDGTSASVSRDLVNYAQLKVNGTTKKTVNSKETFKKTWITKGGTLQSDGRIKFTVTGNGNNNGGPILNGTQTFTDELGGNWAYDGNVTIKKYAQGPTNKGTAISTTTVNVNNKTSWKIDVEGGYYYELTYYAKYTGDSIGKPSISNTAGIIIGVGGTNYTHKATWSGTGNEYNCLEKTFDKREGNIAFWESKIISSLPAGSVYTDYRDSYHMWTFTDEQIAGVKVMKGGQELIAGTDAETADYKIEKTTNGYKITFLKAVNNVSDASPITITYQTTLKTDDVKAGESAKYVNKAKVQTPGGASDTAQAQCSYLSDQKMTKEAGTYNDKTGEMTWFITVNNTGSILGDATVVDNLPEGVTFVSAEISDKGSKASASKLESVSTSGNKVTMELSGLVQSGDKNAYVKIKVVTKVTDRAFLTGNGSKEFTNTADLVIDNTTVNTSSAVQKITNNALTKSGEYNEDTAPNVVYTINVNPNGLNMLQDGDTIRIEDTMSTNMMLRSDTLTIKDKDGNTIQPVNLKIEGNVFSFDVPDDKALTITYKAYVMGEVGKDATISNKVNYYGYAETTGETEENVIKIAKSKASIEGAVGFYIVKKDANDINKLLEGTEFTLYEVGSDTSVTKAANKNGIIAFVGLDEEKVYAYKETKAVDGYLIGAANSQLSYVAFNSEAVENADLPEGVDAEDVQIIQSGVSIEKYNEFNASTSIEFEGTKTLEDANYELGAGTFKFKITGPNLTNDKGEAVNSLTVSHDADGNIDFPVIGYQLKDLDGNNSKTYEYTIEEKSGDKAGVEYSDDVYVVKVKVVKNNNGTISASIVDVTKNGEDYSGNKFNFVNKYVVDDITTTVEGVKNVEGLELRANDYEFKLTETTEGVSDPYEVTVKNDADGSFEFQLPDYTLADHGKTFTYEIKEVNGGKPGMTYDDTVYTVTVAIEDNKEGELTLEKTIMVGEDRVNGVSFTNSFEGSVELTKTNGKDGDAKELLGGAQFELFVETANGWNSLGVYTTADETGKLSVSGLDEGSYYFVETKAPAGYDIVVNEDGTAKEYPFVIGPHGGEAVVNATIEVDNNQKLGTLSLKKVDAETEVVTDTETDAEAPAAPAEPVETEVLIAGAVFDLYKDGEIYQEGMTTDENGMISISGLPWGEYYFVETSPAPGYALDPTPTETVVINEDYVDEVTGPVTVTKTNKQIEFRLSKTDITGETAVAGAEIEIFRVADPSNLEESELESVYYWTSDGEVLLLKGELVAGETYLLREVKAPVGYGYIAADILFTVENDGTITSEAPFAEDEEGNKILLVQDKAIKLEISKSSLTTGAFLAGAEFAIYDKETGAEVYRWTSTEEGFVDIGAYLSAEGTYILKEEVAPVGYMAISDVEFSVDRDGNIEIIDAPSLVTYEDGRMDVANRALPLIDIDKGNDDSSNRPDLDFETGDDPYGSNGEDSADSDKDPDHGEVQTGDETSLMTNMILMTLAALGMTAALLPRRKRQ